MGDTVFSKGHRMNDTEKKPQFHESHFKMLSEKTRSMAGCLPSMCDVLGSMLCYPKETKMFPKRIVFPSVGFLCLSST